MSGEAIKVVIVQFKGVVHYDDCFVAAKSQTEVQRDDNIWYCISLSSIPRTISILLECVNV